MAEKFVTLPDIYIVGGSSENLIFNILSNDLKPIDLTNRVVNFSVSEYTNLDGSIVLNYSSSDGNNISVTESQIRVFVSSLDTKYLCGKYVYQITIDNFLNRYVVFQGSMFVKRNINASIIEEGD